MLVTLVRMKMTRFFADTVITSNHNARKGVVLLWIINIVNVDILVSISALTLHFPNKTSWTFVQFIWTKFTNCHATMTLHFLLSTKVIECVVD